MTNVDLGNRLLDWHGGQETMLYAVGSCLSAGCSVPPCFMSSRP